MKTLAIALCIFLVVLPVSAQQIAAARTANFCVPYGVRDVPLDAAAMESSSDAVRIAEPPQRGGVPPMRRPYPMRPGRYRGYGPGYRSYWQPPDSTAEAVVGAVIAVIVVAVLAGGDR